MLSRKITSDLIADFVIHFYHDHGDCVTNLKLQKLVYYIQAWYLAINNKPLFQEDFEAWVHGPVIPALYRRFKKYSFSDILEHPDSPQLQKSVIDHIKEVLKVYSGFSAFQLEQMTHNEDPWLKARKGIPEDESCTNIIKKSDMTVFYKKLAAT
ncbi:MAG TPA: type II toxin-antitoxin system antitoxin SocA domain-containing protein [Chitinispirillaceae bacterium]|nr:type II toxin-antitoxin system antitoxin SocA domain-containing protein [Chitinispirillaceae bacterium]